MNAPIVSFNHVGKSFAVNGFELEAIREFNLDIAEEEGVGGVTALALVRLACEVR